MATPQSVAFIKLLDCLHTSKCSDLVYCLN